MHVPAADRQCTCSRYSIGLEPSIHYCPDPVYSCSLATAVQYQPLLHSLSSPASLSPLPLLASIYSIPASLTTACYLVPIPSYIILPSSAPPLPHLRRRCPVSHSLLSLPMGGRKRAADKLLEASSSIKNAAEELTCNPEDQCTGVCSF